MGELNLSLQHVFFKKVETFVLCVLQKKKEIPAKELI